LFFLLSHNIPLHTGEGGYFAGAGDYISSPVSFILKTVLKVMMYPRLFHDHVRHMPGLYFPVYRKTTFGNGAVPHIMIPLAMPQEGTAVFQQLFPDFFLVLCHYATTATRSALK
jgi:hypothetical protein